MSWGAIAVTTAVAGGGYLAAKSLGGGGTKGQGVSTKSTLTPQQQLALNEILQYIYPQIGEQGRVPPSSLGPVGPSGLQQQAFGMAGQLPRQMAWDPNQINQVGQYAQEMFQQKTIPSIMGALGYEGSARSSGAADILGREGRNLGMGIASMEYQGYQDAMNRQMQLPSVMGNIGTLQRSIPAEQQAFELSRYMQQDPLRNPAINLGLQAAGMPTQENIAFQGYRQPSMFESLLPALGTLGGGTMQGAGAAGGFGNLFG